MPQYSNDDLLDSLRECKSKHGEISHTVLNDDDNMPSGPTYSYRFGSLSAALDKAGLNNEAKSSRNREGKRTTKYTINEIITHLNDMSEDGEISRKMVVQSDGPTYQTICRHSDDSTLKSFVESNTGLDFVDEYKREIRDRDTIEEELKEADKQNRYLSISLLQSVSDYPSMDEVVYHFESLDSAGDKLGLTVYGSALDKYKDIFSEHYLYVLVVRQDGEDKFYVGETSNLHNRLSSHMSSDRFDIQRIDKVISVDEENARDEERKLSLDIARENETTDIMGGK